MKLLLLATLLAASTTGHAETFTLYRSSVVIDNARLHIATFDAEEKPVTDYNRGNCETAADLFQHQPGVRTRFWCEKGTFRKSP